MSNSPASNVNKLRGIPFIGPFWYQYLSFGNVFYVSSGHANAADDSGQGEDPVTPFKTIDYAIGKCTANNGDTILVLPGHTEEISDAGDITCDVAGINIIGLGVGRQRPTITYSTATDASFLVSAANVRIENLFFDCTGFDAIVAPIDVNAADCTLRHIEMLMADAAGQCTNAIVTDANANRFRLEDSYLYAETNDAGTTNAVEIVGGDGAVIENNVIAGYFTTSLGAIRNQTTACTRILIKGNLLDNRTAVSTTVIAIAAGSTGWVINNRFGILNGTAPVTAAALFAIGGNYYAAAAGVTAGTLV